MKKGLAVVENKQKILISIGDIAGIGTEIALKSIYKLKSKNFIPILIGNLEIIKMNLDFLNIPKTFYNFNILNEKLSNIIDDINILNVINIDFKEKFNFSFGKPNIFTGKYSYIFFEKAVNILKNKNFIKKGFYSLITSPISKEFWELAKMPYSAHTEALKKMTKSKNVAMIFSNSKIIITLATRHVPISNIKRFLNKNSLQEAIDTSINFLNFLGIKNKKIGISGVNPHSGENGHIGLEEIELIIPTLKLEKYKNIEFLGPTSLDALILKSIKKEINIIIAMYHDEGILPLKAMDYYGCTNITFGLPFIRVSPGHGTGFDIAGKGIANEKAFINSIKWCLKLSKKSNCS